MWWRYQLKVNPLVAHLTTACLIISGISGILVAYHFYPNQAFVSVVGIDTVVPFGRFFRGLHFWSSQVFFLLLLWHLFESLITKAFVRRRLRDWTALVLLVPGALLALFTGYVLREDQTGQAAGTIAEHLALALPWAGRLFNALVFDLEHSGLIRTYTAHVLLFLLIFGGSLWYHFRSRLGSSELLLALILAGIPALGLAAPLEMDTGATLIKGPWFFLGVQELLRILPPFVAGILYPATPIVALILFSRAPRPAWIVLGLWSLSYLVLTLSGEIR
ncbi:cytochrome b N-terminal domain-containing protein [Thermosulfuriphilus sp.]